MALKLTLLVDRTAAVLAAAEENEHEARVLRCLADEYDGLCPSSRDAYHREADRLEALAALQRRAA